MRKLVVVAIVAALSPALLVVACSDSGESGGVPAGSSGTSGTSGSPGSSGTSGGTSGTSGGTSGTSGGSSGADGGDAGDAVASAMSVTSSVVTDGKIPSAHTCDGAGSSLPLAWTGAPAGTQSYAVVMRDLTLTSGGDNYHWVIWDIPALPTSLAQGVANDANPSPPGGGAKQTYWSFGAQFGYGGPCPIAGPTTHEYEITVYAFSTATLPSATDATSPTAVDSVIQANKTAAASLKAQYTKQ